MYLGYPQVGNFQPALLGNFQPVLTSSKKTDPRSRWVLAVAARRHQNVAVVALANRMARTAYALLAKGEDYQADHVLQTA